jgi:hypothetical protein
MAALGSVDSLDLGLRFEFMRFDRIGDDLRLRLRRRAPAAVPRQPNGC